MILRGTFEERIGRRNRSARRGIRLALGLAVGGLLAVAAPSAAWAISAGCAAVNAGGLDYTTSDVTVGAGKSLNLPFTAGEVVTATFKQISGNYSPGSWYLIDYAGGPYTVGQPNPTNNDTLSLTARVLTDTFSSGDTSAGGTGSGTAMVNHVCTGPAAVQAPDLTISKTHNGNATAGQTGFPYTITVSNNLPSGLTVGQVSALGWNCSGTTTTVTCVRSDALGSNMSYPAITLTVNVASNAPSSITNTATVFGGGETRHLQRYRA